MKLAELRVIIYESTARLKGVCPRRILVAPVDYCELFNELKPMLDHLPYAADSGYLNFLFCGVEIAAGDVLEGSVSILD